MPSPAAPTDKVPLGEKLAYGAGQGASKVMTDIDNSLLRPIFVLSLGASPALLGLFDVLYRLWDAFTDLFMGWVSDNTRSRWGRRRPYILAGAVLCALWMPVLWLFDRSWSLPAILTWMVVAQLGIFLFATIFNVPWQCLLLEISPDTHERTRVSAMRSYFAFLVGLPMAWVWWFVQLPAFNDASGQPDMVRGAFWVTVLGSGLVLVCGVLPALFCRERYYHTAARRPKTSLRKDLRATLLRGPFLRLVAITTLFLASFYAVESVSFFTRMFYVFGGDQKAAAWFAGVSAPFNAAASLLAIPICQWAASRWGKRAVLLASIACFLAALLCTWITFRPGEPYWMLVNSMLGGMGVSAFWILAPSLCADVVDEDELHTGQRREGSFAAVYSWMTKLAFSLSAGASGFLVEWCGFQAGAATQSESTVFLMRLTLLIVPAVTLTSAFALALRFPLTTARMTEIRTVLEGRRHLA